MHQILRLCGQRVRVVYGTCKCFANGKVDFNHDVPEANCLPQGLEPPAKPPAEPPAEPPARPLPSLLPKLPNLVPTPQPRVQPNLLPKGQPSLQPSLQLESPFL